MFFPACGQLQESVREIDGIDAGTASTFDAGNGYVSLFVGRYVFVGKQVGFLGLWTRKSELGLLRVTEHQRIRGLRLCLQRFSQPLYVLDRLSLLLRSHPSLLLNYNTHSNTASMQRVRLYHLKHVGRASA